MEERATEDRAAAGGGEALASLWNELCVLRALNMGTIGVFEHVTVDGFFAGPNGEIDWFKAIKKDDDFEAYTHQQASSDSTLLFGRTTYEMMKSFWPTPDAIKSDPDMANAVNKSPKIVFSKTLQSVEEGPNWQNVKLRREIDRDEILELKKKGDVTILGSGTIVQQLANLGLIDEFQLVLVPLVLGSGKSLFNDVRNTDLKLQETKSFQNGLVVLRYRPA